MPQREVDRGSETRRDHPELGSTVVVAGRPARQYGRRHQRRDGEPQPIPAGVVRPWPGQDDGPGGHTVFRTQAAVQLPLTPVDAEDDRRRSAPGCITAAKPPWELGPPPQHSARAVRGPEHSARAVRGPVMCTLRRVARAPA
jgi:hypothetical protein